MKKKRLLIIDDNKEILAALYDFFSKKSYEVVSASNGLEGLNHLETDKKSFDLIVTDLVMPNISGVGVVSIVKKKHPNIPIIAITGWGEYPEALAAEAQANAVLEKPFDLEDLEELIVKLISNTVTDH